jgi:hypothetical protein
MTKAKPPIIMRRERNRPGLHPIDAWAAEQVDALPFDKDLSVRVTLNRSHGRLNWWWAGLGLMVDNLPDHQRKMWPTARKMHNAILEALGFVERIYRIDGTFRTEVDSVSFEAMDEEEFIEVFERGRALAIGIVGYDPFELWMQEAKAKGRWR